LTYAAPLADRINRKCEQSNILAQFLSHRVYTENQLYSSVTKGDIHFVDSTNHVKHDLRSARVYLIVPYVQSVNDK